MSAENAWNIAREILATMPTKYLARCPMPPAFRAEVEAEVQRRAIADRAAMPGYMPRYFGVWSSTGLHIGIWEDPIIALEVLGEYPGGVTREMVDVTTFRAAVEADMQGVVEALRYIDRDATTLSEAQQVAAALLSRLEAKGGRAMSEADRLWREAIDHVADAIRDAAPEPRGALSRSVRNFCMALSGQIKKLPRPAGWGEGGKDE